MYKKHVIYWLIGVLLLAMMSSCDNGKQAPKEVPPAATLPAQENVPINNSTPLSEPTSSDIPPVPEADKPTLQTPHNPTTAIKIAPKVEGQVTTKIQTNTETKIATKRESNTESPSTQQVSVPTITPSREGLTSKPTQLKAAPQLDAETILTLPTSAHLRIFERQGAWYRVSAVNDQGWVKMLHLSFTADSSNTSADSELASVAAIATGREGSDNVTATTGIRGLNEENLATAAPNMARLQTLDSFAVSKVEAEKFALRNGLTTRTIAYLKEPKK